MKKVFDGKMIAPTEFLDDVEEVLSRYDKELVYSKEFRSSFRWNCIEDRNLRNRFKVIFPGYELVSKVLRFEFGINVSRWQLMLVINGIYSPSAELIEALEEIYRVAKQHVIANNFGADYLGREYCSPIEEEARGEWYVPIILGKRRISRYLVIIVTSFTCIHTNGVYQQYKGNICNRAFKCGSELPEYMALILRNGGSQSPDRWLRELRNNQI